MDTISYWTGPASEMTDTQNEMDRKLYRRCTPDGKPSTTDVIAIVTQFGLDYQNLYKDSIAAPTGTGVVASRLSEIRVVVVTVEVQSPYAPYRYKGMVHSGERDAWYSSSLWQQTRLVSMNFNR